MARRDKGKHGTVDSTQRPAAAESNSGMHLRSHTAPSPPIHAELPPVKRRRQNPAATVNVPPPPSTSSSSSEDSPLKHIVIRNHSAAVGAHAVDAAAGFATVADPAQSDQECEDADVPEDTIHMSKHAERYQEQVPHFAVPANVHEASPQHEAPAAEEDSTQQIDGLSWPSYTDIVPPVVPGNHLGLKVQSPPVQEVLRRGIRLVFVSFCFNQAFAYASNKDLSHASDENCIRKALVRAARKLGTTDIKHRLQRDDLYAKTLGAILQSRIDNWRSQLRHNAACVVSTAYGLDKLQDNELQGHIDELLARHTHYYYLFAQDEHGEPNFKKPFLQPVFAQLLYKTFFSTSKQMGQVCLEAFKLKDGTYEIPEPLLALVATAVELLIVFSALDGLRSSGVKRKFCADAYSSVYEDVLETLHILATDPATKDSYHPLLAKIYAMAQSPLPRPAVQRLPLVSTGVPEIDLDN
ncbi:hypothetical protein NM688_g2438 [Phlebia brevispora]|uniref:Uncharacterized protein n=1 Tax=Phlebia brevispora TaxID=194682 RepID=A0ACC1T8V5_9APHY|nr:hypothetical protein NM688_g2438 [Phlebia brevispora]